MKKLLNQDTLQILFEKGEKREFKKGEVIVSNEQKPTLTYFIQKGHVAIYSGIAKSDERLLAILKRKDVFPLLQSIVRSYKPAKFLALDDVVVYSLAKKDFESAMKDPSVTQGLLENVCNLLITYIERVDNLELAKADSRLIARLIFFANKFGTKKGVRVSINLPMTHAAIAHSIAVTRETVTRELIKLEKNGFIAYSNRKIVILDLPKLEAELKRTLG